MALREHDRHSASPWFYSDRVDMVFEGVFKDFTKFDESLTSLHTFLEGVEAGVLGISDGLRELSEGIARDFAAIADRGVVSECCRLREATNQIAHVGAPHSALAKFQRNLTFNVRAPLQNHLDNNERLREEVEKRRRRLDELKAAKEQVDECLRCDLSENDPRFLMAQSEFEVSKQLFVEIDRSVFEWLYALDSHRDDILDSSLQSLTYLQYDFLSTAAHALGNTLPKHIEFQSMASMTPERLRPRDGSVGNDAGDSNEEDAAAAFSERLLRRRRQDANERLDATGSHHESQHDVDELPVNAMSLAVLLGHGFEEGPARRALRGHQNDTQAALQTLLAGESDAQAAKTRRRRPAPNHPGNDVSTGITGSAVAGEFPPVELGLPGGYGTR